MSISSILYSWYLEKKRDLPWRNTSDPYKIWVSEIILQQTRVAQGLGYYHRFLASFPDIFTLASADIADVLKVWQGLGYYSRARNIHAGAICIVNHLNGKMPENYEGLIKIKGIGEYTAAAIGSFAFNLPLAVVDGNVNRFIARFFGIHDSIKSPNGVKKIKQLAEKILDTDHPGLHNQAIMEFGALQCIARNPDCNICPLHTDCYAKLHDEVALLPVNIKQQTIRNRYFNYLVILYHNYIYIRNRSGNDIWQGLYDFPLLETEKEIDETELQETSQWATVFQDTAYKILNISPVYIHQLSHQKLYAKFFLVSAEKELARPGADALLIKQADIYNYPIPKLIDNYISTIKLENYFAKKT
jgi:A/G-specific adenine glycosylase